MARAQEELVPDATDRVQALLDLARRTRGFMPDDEGEALYRAARRAGDHAVPAALPPTFVEIGAWCGKSTVYLGAAAEASGSVLFSIDHHRGSEENQPGWEYHESDLVDAEAGRIDTLLHWRRTITAAGLETSVVGVIGDSPTVAARSGPAAVAVLHRRRPRRGAGVGRLQGLGAPRGGGRLAGDPRRLSRPGRRRAPALRALLRRARLG